MACGCRKLVNMPQQAASFPDTMRHGRFPFEVRGSDHAALVAYGYGNLVDPLTEHNTVLNQAESGGPLRTDVNRLHRNASQLVRQMAPLVIGKRYNNDIGAIVVRSAHNNTIVFDPKYAGIAPMQLQPKIDKPYPYALPPKTP